MAKAGILALTKSAALEYGRQGIRVNALVAGGFRTPMLEGMMERVSGGNQEAREAIEKRYSELAPGPDRPAGRGGRSGSLAVFGRGLIRHGTLHDRGRRI